VDNPVATAIFGAFPQMLLILYAPLGLVGAKTPVKKLLGPAVALTVIVSVTRFIPGLLGWHIPIFLFAYLLVAQLFQLTSPIAALASAALSFILIATGDMAVALPVLRIFDIKWETTLDSWIIRSAFGWLESFFLIVAALLVKFKSFVLIPIAPQYALSGKPGDPGDPD